MDGCSYENNTLQGKSATTQDEHQYFPQYIINSAGNMLKNYQAITTASPISDSTTQ